MIPSTWRRLMLPLLAAALASPLAACASDTLSDRDARSVRVGQVLDASYTAAVRGTRSHVMLPSGRVDLTLSKPLDEVAAQDTAGAAPLRPSEGAKAVGVAWSLNRGAYPNSFSRQLAPPEAIFGRPQPVRLWLVTDGTRREIPTIGTLEVPVRRARNAAWLIVPSGVRRWHFEIDFAGVTQRVDARSGEVAPGAAVALYQPLPLDRDGSCEVPNNGFNYTGCDIKFAVGYPYVDGAGWAPKGKVFVLMQTSSGSLNDVGKNLRVAGASSVTVVYDYSELFRAFPVTPARTYPVRGTGAVEDGGKSHTVPVTGTLTTGGTP